MKNLTLYIHLFFVLQICGSNFIFLGVNNSVESFSSKQNVEKKVKVKQQSSNHYNLDIESTDVDLDEESYHVDDCGTIDLTTIFSWRDGLSNSKYFSFFGQKNFNSYSLQNTVYKLLLVDSTPIYLQISVLRI